MGEMQTITINGKKYEIEGHPPYLSDQGTWMVYDTEANAYVDTQISGVGHDYVLTDEDKEEIAKLNTLIVTPPGDGDISSSNASHTPAEILAHVQSGGTAVLLDGETYAYLFSCDEEKALFTSLDDGAKTYSYAIRSSGMFAYSKIEYNTRDMISRKITAPTTAQVGQTIVVKKVNSNGEPTAWEAVDLPSGGASSWNDIPDKPFITKGGDTLTWDGNTEGLAVFGGMYYKVSDVILTTEDVANGATVAMTMVMDGVTENVTLPAIVTVDGALVLTPEGLDGSGMNVYSLTAEVAATIGVEAGTYMPFVSEGTNCQYLSSLTIPGYTGFTTEKIDPKVLPESDVVVVHMNSETGKLDRSLSEINELNLYKGKVVLFDMTMSPLVVSDNGNGTYTAQSTVFLHTGVEDGKVVFTSMTVRFGTDGICTGQEMSMFEATALG